MRANYTYRANVDKYRTKASRREVIMNKRAEAHMFHMQEPQPYMTILGEWRMRPRGFVHHSEWTNRARWRN